ncbi:MAG: ArsA family ATPase [Nitriliruptoraceae bacterium]
MSRRTTARPLRFVGGKGGVGKTTISTVLATAWAASGLRTLLVSTDPAHSTGDLLGVQLRDEPTPVADRLDAVEIDAQAVADAYVERVRRDAHRVVDPAVRATVDRHLDLASQGAGTLESALVDRLADLVAEVPGRYDRMIVDTAPTGHTLRLLALPELVTRWVEGLVRQREGVRGMDRMLENLAGREARAQDPVLDHLHAQRERLRIFRKRLLEDARFHLVMIPERLPIEETARALPQLEDAGLQVGALVVNRVLPAIADGHFLEERREQQHAYLEEIRHRFADRELVLIEQRPRDLSSPDDLEPLRQQLMPLVHQGSTDDV